MPPYAAGDIAADLHVHTTASDGTVGLDERLDQAADRGLDAFAVTDHDVIPEQLSAATTTVRDVEVVTGVEVRAGLLGTKIEILGYFVDPADEALQSLLCQAREFRCERNRALVSNLTEMTRLELNYETLSESVIGNLGRPHLADILVEEGVVDSVGQAFEEYLAEGADAFVPMERLSAVTVINTLHNAGGVSSLAHPGRIRSDAESVERIVHRLAKLGLDGLEVNYPYADDRSDDYATVGVAEAAELAIRQDLCHTGGSDCHGPGSGKFRIGSVGVSKDGLECLRASCGDARRDSRD